MLRIIVALGLLSVVALGPVPAHASVTATPPCANADAAPARRYAHGSLSLAGGVGAGFVSTPIANSTYVSLSTTVRWVTHEGFTVMAGVSGSATYGQLQIAPGGSGGSISGGGVLQLGWAFALSPNVAITPNVFAAASIVHGFPAPGGVALSSDTEVAGVEFPIEVFVARHVAIEPVMNASVSLQTPSMFQAASGVRVLFVF